MQSLERHESTRNQYQIFDTMARSTGATQTIKHESVPFERSALLLRSPLVPAGIPC